MLRKPIERLERLSRKLSDRESLFRLPEWRQLLVSITVCNRQCLTSLSRCQIEGLTNQKSRFWLKSGSLEVVWRLLQDESVNHKMNLKVTVETTFKRYSTRGLLHIEVDQQEASRLRVPEVQSQESKCQTKERRSKERKETKREGNELKEKSKRKRMESMVTFQKSSYDRVDIQHIVIHHV